MALILTVNPGATSTKIGVFRDEQLVLREEITYTANDFTALPCVHAQVTRRWQDIRQVLHKAKINNFDAVVGRGGLIGPVKPGAYLVNQALLDKLEHNPVLEHASNIGAAISTLAAQELGLPDCKVLIYDPVTVDEMDDVCRITGMKNIVRKSIGHHLNMRKVAVDLANKIGKSYQDASIVVLHMGGGSSASVHVNGHIVDFISDDEVQFSAERSGGLPLKEIMKVAIKEGAEKVANELRKNGGIMSHFGTSDTRVVEAKMADGDPYATLVLQALALQVAKAMAALAVSAHGQVDAFAFTGGMAHSKFLCEQIRKRIEFIAPFYSYPGEFELEALAAGALRVLRGEEQANIYND